MILNVMMVMIGAASCSFQSPRSTYTLKSANQTISLGSNSEVVMNETSWEFLCDDLQRRRKHLDELCLVVQLEELRPENQQSA